MKRFKYQVTYEMSGNLDIQGSMLSDLGERGWELVSTVVAQFPDDQGDSTHQGWVFYLKRPLDAGE